MEGYKYLSDTGVIVADTADTRDTVVAEFRNMYGQDLIVTSDTPQGTLINAETAARVEVMRNNAQLANQINPKLAGAQYLDAICSFMNLQRRAATYSLITSVTLTGQPNTPVPAGARARSRSNDLWRLVAGVTLGADGTATGQFRCITSGPIQCATGNLDTVVDMVLGWETVTNTVAATLGSDEQSDASLRMLRVNTLAKNGISFAEAITSALYDEPVSALSVAFRENYKKVDMTIDGVDLVANSIWVCVDGGADEDIAMALLRVKTIGADWNGPVDAPVVEPISGQTYDVKFQRPTLVPVEVQLTVRRGLYTGDPVLESPGAVVNYAAGNVENMPGFVLNSIGVAPDQIAAAVATQLPGLFVVGTSVRNVGSTTWQNELLPLAIWEKATVATGNVYVTVMP